MQNLPYSNDFLEYNYTTHRYRLTRAAVEQMGINLSRFKSPNAVEAILNQISAKIYAFIHDFNVDNDLQDYVIAKTETGRRIIQEAMEQQFIYESAVGNVDLVLSADKRGFRIAPITESVLLKIIPEIGAPIVYTGNLQTYINDNGAPW